MITSRQCQQSIEAIILDMDGVLWRDGEPIGDLQSIFKRIKENGWKVVFATNNSTNTIHQYVQLLDSFGIHVEAWQIITSANAVIYHLIHLFPSGGNVYIIGEEGVISACTQYGYQLAEEDAVAVIAGMDRKLTYEKLKIGTLLIRKGVTFIGTNPDHTFPTPQGLIPGAGSILAALTTASGIKPIIAGKPEPTMYQIALERLNMSPKNVLVVGDRPETDIAGAQAIGCHTALVLSGVTDTEQANKWQPRPDIIVADLQQLVNMDWIRK